MLRVISQRALAQWQQPVKRAHSSTSFDGFFANTAWRPCGRQQQQSFSRGGPSAFLLVQHRFFTSSAEAATTTKTTATQQQLNTIWRVYIRPHYYNNGKSKLSQALNQQRNPFRQFGRRLNDVNPNSVLYSVIGANVAVFFMWQYAINCYRQFGDGSWLNFMRANFVNSREAIQHGYYHTLLTSAFSHKDMGHLGLNMLVLYSMGQAAIEAIGASRFLLLYAGAGIAGSLATQAYQKWIRPQLVKKSFFSGRRQFGGLGASGSVMGITAFYACACKFYQP
ncbi:hypothetical protein BDB00DRAFT_760466 [Zychaea mexicana]|uniref:uncharacterized protein n=1 Tax=Zychaea mexicana TaxID=64656 RepID=UPI0022FDB7DE|nr:uncharacterized protein BDB00DRAFT_760466 [Zychaea mexicana]KAI9495163.1 hypothetical protein BDB00DRAFT_760466 [Zychaea mexicana]